ncbi:hypothetical protein Tco_0960784, partial [Tanacetum coccineum]
DVEAFEDERDYWVPKVEVVVENEEEEVPWWEDVVVGGVEKISSTRSKFMANREDCLDGCDGASDGEVKGGGVDFGVLKSSLGETIGESGGDIMGLGGGPVW